MTSFVEMTTHMTEHILDANGPRNRLQNCRVIAQLSTFLDWMRGAASLPAD